MPVLWLYLLTHYLRTLLLCVCCFISILFVMRLDEIARFAALGPTGIYVLLYAIYQIPYILPIALPVACLISSILIVQRLSSSHELTALRACGIPFRSIFAPILFVSCFLALGNFYVVSEMATRSHLTAGLLKTELRALNPLYLMHNKHLMKLKGFFFHANGPAKVGESVSEVVLAMPSKKNHPIHLFIAEQLEASPDNFKARNLTTITSLGASPESLYDSLLVENVSVANASTQDFAQFFQKSLWKLSNDHLPMRGLMLRLKREKSAMNERPSQPEQSRKEINKIYSEIVRRISAALSVFVFAFVGVAFGVSIGRERNNRGIFCVIFLATIYLTTFFLAKGMELSLPLIFLFYLAPHLLMITAGFWTLSRASRGIS